MVPEQRFERPRNFHELVSRLIQLGYYTVPIPPGCKGPTIEGWQHLRMTEQDVPKYFNQPDMLVGILHKNTGFIDIDVYCPELAETIASEARRRFPGALERVGQYPKTAIVFALDPVGFKVKNTVKGTVEGDGAELSAQVEIRTLTRQAVAYGRHPETQEYYKWVNGPELWETPHSDLPVLTKEEVEDFRDWADAKIREWAGIQDEPAANVVNISALHPVAGGDRASEEQFLEALKHVAADADYDTWLQCLMGIHDFYGGSEAGLSTAQKWSADYHNYKPAEIVQKWRSFEVGKGTTYKTVFALAKQHGADLSAIARMGVDPAPEVKASLNLPTSAPEPVKPTPQTISDFKIDSSADFLSDLRPLEYLIDGLLPAGVTYSITGYAGHGKTSLALQFALSVARGEMFGGRDTSKGRVLILAGENPYNVKWQYAAALAAQDLQANEVDIDFVQGRFSIDQWGGVLRAKMEAMTDLKLVIVDSLQAFFEGDNDNDNTQMVEMAHKLRDLSDTTHRPAILIIAHPAGKTPSKDNLVPRGGGAFLNEIDGNLTVWSQDASQQTLHHSQKFRGAGFDPMEWVMQIHEFPHLTDIHGTPLKLPVSRPETTFERTSREADTDSLLRRYLDTVEQGAPISVRAGASQFGISRWRMEQLVNTAKDEKLIRRHAKTFVLTDGGKDFLEARNAGV